LADQLTCRFRQCGIEFNDLVLIIQIRAKPLDNQGSISGSQTTFPFPTGDRTSDFYPSDSGDD
jgi:hypothetical protein